MAHGKNGAFDPSGTFDLPRKMKPKALAIVDGAL